MTETGAIVLKSIFALVGLLCFVGAYFIAIKGRTDLIAGYVPGRVKNEKMLARFMGSCTFLIGAVTILFPWVHGFDRTTPLRWTIYFCISVLIIALFMIVVSSWFERKKAE